VSRVRVAIRQDGEVRCRYAGKKGALGVLEQVKVREVRQQVGRETAGAIKAAAAAAGSWRDRPARAAVGSKN
jgi:hypothetical protein